MQPIVNLISCLLLLTMHQAAFAQAINCAPHTTRDSLTVDYSHIQRSEMHAPSSYHYDGIASAIKWHGQHWRAEHHYLALDFPNNTNDAPATNGDLHSLVLGRFDNVPLDSDNTLAWELAPTLAVSSNQLKHTEQLQASGLHLAGMFTWTTRLAEHQHVLVGVCAGTLTGEYESIPVLGYQYSGKLDVLVGYPRSNLSFGPAPGVVLQLSWSIEGGNWEILDDKLENRSDFSYSGRQFTAVISFAITSTFSIHAQWASLYAQEFDYRSQSGTHMSIASDDNDAVLVGLKVAL